MSPICVSATLGSFCSQIQVQSVTLGHFIQKELGVLGCLNFRTQNKRKQQKPTHNINKNKKYSHCLWLLKFPYLLNVVHEVPTVDIFHDEVQPVL